jgi:hypothetical protein
MGDQLLDSRIVIPVASPAEPRWGLARDQTPTKTPRRLIIITNLD